MGLKSSIIPENWKSNIDELLKVDLLQANRYFAQINPKIAKLIEAEAFSNPPNFNKELISRWNWHNSFYENLLEPAIPALLEGGLFGMPPQRIDLIKNVFITSSYVDQATLVMSAAIKKHADYWSTHFTNRMRLNEEESLMTLSIPTESFWIYYLQDHLRYIVSIKKGEKTKAEEIKKNLMIKYHAEDPKIFEGRLKRFEWTDSEDAIDLERHTESLSLSSEYKTKHFYFTSRRPWVKALQDTLIFDNCDEYQLLYSLKGISGFILRKKILESLNDTKILPNLGKIYEFSDEIITKSLDKLKKYRLDFMAKDVQPYTQSGLTCGAACLMLAENYFGLGNLTKDRENQIHEFSKSNLVEGEHFSGLALHAAMNGLEILLIHSEQDMFRFSNSLFSQDLFNKLMNEYRSFLAKSEEYSLRVENNSKIDPMRVQELLKQDYLVLIAGIIGDSILHANLAVGYDSNGTILIDPLTGQKRTLNNNSLDRFMDTPIGKWILAVRRDESQLNKLSEGLSNYEKQAKAYLSQK